MPSRFPILRLLVPIAALGCGLSLLAGVVAAITLFVLGVAAGRTFGGVIDGVAAAAGGVGGAFCLAAVGEAAQAVLEIHAELVGSRSLTGGHAAGGDATIMHGLEPAGGHPPAAIPPDSPDA